MRMGGDNVLNIIVVNEIVRERVGGNKQHIFINVLPFADKSESLSLEADDEFRITLCKSVTQSVVSLIIHSLKITLQNIFCINYISGIFTKFHLLANILSEYVIT